MIKLGLKRSSTDVESYESVYLQVTGVEVTSKLPKLPGLQQIPISCNICIRLSITTLLVWLCGSIYVGWSKSWLLYFYALVAMCLLVCPCYETIQFLATGYGYKLRIINIYYITRVFDRSHNNVCFLKLSICCI